MSATVADLVSWFASERGVDAAPLQPHELRHALYSLLISRAALPIPEHLDVALRELYAAESAARETTDAEQLPRWAGQEFTQVSVWQGDITTLRIDAITNAANAQMLGCFAPDHRCIDNAIHAIAGPWLRAECAELMATQGHPEPTGQAKITDGHYLPARQVVHTVGPIVRDGVPTAQQEELLASCYRSVLDVVHSAGGRSVALCCISTGVFGYPIEQAAPVAIRTVLDWLHAHPPVGEEAPMHVVFNTFSDHDTLVYREALNAVTP